MSDGRTIDDLTIKDEDGAVTVDWVVLTAAIIGVRSVVAGLIISYHANTSGSATMAVVPIALFFVVLTMRSFRQRARAVVTV